MVWWAGVLVAGAGCASRAGDTDSGAQGGAGSAAGMNAGGSSGTAGTAGTGHTPQGGAGAGSGGGSAGASGGGGSAGTATGGRAGSGAGSSGDGGAGPSGAGGIAAGGTSGAAGEGAAAGVGGTSGASAGSAGTSGNGGAAGAEPSGPQVDRSTQRLYQSEFSAADADAGATRALGTQFAYLDTRVEPKGKLVIYLHGAGEFTNCGNGAFGTLVASFGYHWFGPCFLSNYGVDNCGDDIEGCRLEALEGADHHPFVDIARPDSIEERIVRGLEHLTEINPEGDWSYFVDGGAPRWSDIIVTGHSHGASTSGVIGVHHEVFRVVMLAGPYDPGQAWLSSAPLTPSERFFGLSHTGDSQHSGHLAAWESLGLPGTPVRGDGAEPPYGNSHRLYTSVSTGDAHGSVQSGNIDGLVPVWRYLYGAD